ncbi:MAG: ATP-binding protein [Myxococcales bacterium]|nr:ATP-binding protein [Myxococcales bacterium]
MNIGVRGKLFAASLVLLLAVGTVSGLYLEASMRSWLEARIADDLVDHARTCADVVEVAKAADSVERVDGLADRLGRSTGARITIIAEDGRVLGDSELDPQAVYAVENHGRRPEVLDARARGRGVIERYSVTIGTRMLYVAVPFEREDGLRGVARASTPLSEVDAVVGRLRLLLLVAGAIGLVLAVIMSGLASHLMTRTLRALVQTTRDISRGERSSDLPVTSGDELGGLAGSVRRLAADLEAGVDELRQERDRFETILESMSEAVLALDADGRITLANRAAAALLGGPEVLEEGRPLLETLRAPQLVDLIDAARSASASTEFDLAAAVGASHRRIVARAAPISSSGGVVVAMHDVTEVRRLETVRRDFVANVSHELRTPVSIIRANAETLLSGALESPDTARRFIEPMQRSATRLGALISDLLDLSRIEAGQYRLEPTGLGLAPLVQRAAEGVSLAADENETRVEIDVDAELQLRADPDALEQILVNLLDNAIKYSGKGGHVRVGAERRGERIRVEVSDDGPGIEERHRARVFERFYRIDTGRSREMGGTGLGLSIVKNLITIQGGEIGVEPNRPKGSRFWFTLPVG